MNEDISKGCIVMPEPDYLISIIGNQDFIVTDTKTILGNTMIKIKGKKGWFNIRDFGLRL